MEQIFAGMVIGSMITMLLFVFIFQKTFDRQRDAIIVLQADLNTYK